MYQTTKSRVDIIVNDLMESSNGLCDILQKMYFVNSLLVEVARHAASLPVEERDITRTMLTEYMEAFRVQTSCLGERIDRAREYAKYIK